MINLIKSLFQKQSQQQIEEQKQLSPNSYKHFNYKTINKNIIKQKSDCLAIAINIDNSLLLVSHESRIKVYRLKNEQLKQVQLIINCCKRVTAIKFFNKYSQSYISSSKDSNIIISSSYLCANPKYIQKLQGNSQGMTNFIINIEEDVIVSCSLDSIIRFWNRNTSSNISSWICSQTIQDHSSYVEGLSINDQSNTVITCGFDSCILIIQRKNSQFKWLLTQKIHFHAFSHQIIFINDNTFAFQDLSLSKLQIYQNINENNQSPNYIKIQEVVLEGINNGNKSYFSSIFNHKKQVLVYKHGNTINFLRVIIKKKTKQKRDLLFRLEQAIDYGQLFFGFIVGTLSEDGQYFITWDELSQQIQLKKYMEL
ncbi:unnamed protein product [Paramecium sonneborni]|uniref:WD40-repeat-containing domain n=1 Tax=Paramecium sonneborni TaxID=65129 RepID=A0A8S1QB93_9CILI|nr:unnamed protein product [Paramecium sonneborni]